MEPFIFDKVLTSTLGVRFDQRPISAKALTITHKLALFLHERQFSLFVPVYLAGRSSSDALYGNFPQESHEDMK
jgi:hypothetical protein